MTLGDAAWQVQEKPVSQKTKAEGQKQVLRVSAYETNASLPAPSAKAEAGNWPEIPPT